MAGHTTVMPLEPARAIGGVTFFFNLHAMNSSH